jgi:hypothetical protein
VPNVLPDPAPLTPDEQAIAAELYYEAIRAAAARQGSPVTEKAARTNARKMMQLGERGLTTLQKIGRATGCLVVIIILVVSIAVTALASAVVAAVIAL